MPFDLEEIGKFLKERRKSKGLTIAEISNFLCIRKNFIEAMEQGNWRILPHYVYVKGYIKEYADYLNVLKEITKDLIEEEKKIIPEILVQQKVKTVSRKISSKIIVYSTISIVLLGFFLVSRIQREQQPFSPQVETKDHVSSPSVYATGTTGQKPQLTTSNRDSKMLIIICQERTWISVIIDENEKKEFMLNPQEIIMLNAKEKFDLLIGNAGGIKMFLNGKDVQFSGRNGDVKRIKLT